MPARHGGPGHVLRHLLPFRNDVVIAADKSNLAPDCEERHGQPGIGIGGIMLEVDGGRGAIILAHGVDRFLPPEAPQIVGKGLVGDRAFGAAPLAAFAAKIEFRIGTDHLFGQWRRLDQEEPVVIGCGKTHVGLPVHRRRRRDIHNGDAADAITVVTRQAVRHAATPVMSGNHEAVMAEPAHQSGHIGCHGAFGVGGVGGIACRMAAVAIAAKVGRNNGISFGKRRGDLVPHHVCLRKAVEQQQRRAVACNAVADAGLVTVMGLETEHVCVLHFGSLPLLSLPDPKPSTDWRQGVRVAKDYSAAVWRCAARCSKKSIARPAPTEMLIPMDASMFGNSPKTTRPMAVATGSSIYCIGASVAEGANRTA